jgi:hypothetical protein
MRGTLRRAAGVALAFVVLNVALSHNVLWPTPLPVPDHRLSPELVWIWWALLGWAAWRGGVSSRTVSVFAAVMAVLAVARYLDVAARELFGRPINLYWDTAQIPRFLAVLAGGGVADWATAAAVLAVIGALGWGLYRIARWALGQLAREAVPVALRSRVALVLSGAAALLALANHAGVQATWPIVSRPVVPTWWAQLNVLATAVSPVRLARALPPSPPFQQALADVAPADLALVFAESYGAVVFDDAPMREALASRRAALARAVADSGQQVVSATVTSPTFGGASELAHLSLLSGIDLGDPYRHDLLLGTDRPTLLGAMREHGWRTYGLYPALSWDWPDRAFYGFDVFLDGRDLDWRGPRLGPWAIPDQFSLARFEQLHPVRAADPPRVLFFATITAHIPFRPVPPYQPDWDVMLGDTPYPPQALARSLAERVDWLRLREGYLGMIAYTYDWLAGWIARPRLRPQTTVVIGDHQPSAAVTGEGARWDVPVHVVSADAALIARLIRLGFVPGLEPDPAPLGRMHQLAPLLLRALASEPAADGQPRPVSDPPIRATVPSMSARAIDSLGGSCGSASSENQRASASSAGSCRSSPPAYSAVNAIISELGNGQLWLPK